MSRGATSLLGVVLLIRPRGSLQGTLPMLLAMFQTYLKSEKYLRSVSDEPTPLPAPLPAPLALPVVPEVPMAEQLLVASGTRASKRRERRRVLAAAIASW